MTRSRRGQTARPRWAACSRASSVAPSRISGRVCAARGAAADRAATLDTVQQVVICTPDKDLSQCVRGARVVQLDRRKRETRDEQGVVARFGVGPASIPESPARAAHPGAGFPGMPGGGERAWGAALGRYVHPERTPAHAADWDV